LAKLAARPAAIASAVALRPVTLSSVPIDIAVIIAQRRWFSDTGGSNGRIEDPRDGEAIAGRIPGRW
jgi:hypothetical protein